MGLAGLLALALTLSGGDQQHAVRAVDFLDPFPVPQTAQETLDQMLMALEETR
ncbi:hypothetical protein [Longimicrobium sp.]|jgi:hypothetical protein|uniref:hypothetical protein n=1 Tax=Longimicrobium sp. TaxID=2029185 RepID=UPI002EDA4EAA